MRAIELFAGAGGLGMGVSRAGFTPAMIVERDRWCCDTIRENRTGGVDALSHWPEPTEGDVRSVDFGPFEEKIELVSGGPPCQPFSLGGKHAGNRDDRDMWPEAVRAVREVKPKAFVFENVKGLTRASFNAYFAYINLQLTYPEVAKVTDEEPWTEHHRRLEQHHSGRTDASEGLTYNVLARVLNAADHGVPQKRERVFFVGFRQDLGIEWSYPWPTHSLDALLWDQMHGTYWERHEVSKRDRVLSSAMTAKAKRLRSKPMFLEPWKTVRDAIGDMPDPETQPQASTDFPDHRFQGGARSYPGHTGSRYDEPAKTLKAGVHGVPGGENMLARSDGSVRYFTVRESARLQTFPDEFRFHGSWTETLRQLGNAVPVDLAKLLVSNLRLHLVRSSKS